MKADHLLAKLSALLELPRPAEYEQIRLDFTKEESDPPTPDDIATRVTWYRNGLEVFESEYVKNYCGRREAGETVPNIPEDGSGHLPMTLEELSEFLTPEFLGQSGYKEMTKSLEAMLVRLLDTFADRDYAVANWNKRLMELRVEQDSWLQANGSDQPAVDTQPAA